MVGRIVKMRYVSITSLGVANPKLRTDGTNVSIIRISQCDHRPITEIVAAPRATRTNVLDANAKANATKESRAVASMTHIGAGAKNKDDAEAHA
jgi:hypothetical protein